MGGYCSWFTLACAGACVVKSRQTSLRSVSDGLAHRVLAFNLELTGGQFMEMTGNPTVTKMQTSPEPFLFPDPNGSTHSRESTLFRKMMSYEHVSWGGTCQSRRLLTSLREDGIKWWKNYWMICWICAGRVELAWGSWWEAQCGGGSKPRAIWDGKFWMEKQICLDQSLLGHFGDLEVNMEQKK